jgi:peptidoglycan/LPS O-acetylase OafA/YrhL
LAVKSIHIDALRGCAIFAVVQHHYGVCFGLYKALGVPDAVVSLLGHGWAGVDVFFVLSAFLLTRNLLAHEGEANAVVIFYRRRILRIVPLYLLIVALAAFLSPVLGTAPGEPGNWLLSGLAPFWVYALFLQNIFVGLYPEQIAQFLAPTWSLAVEEHFYLFLPLLLRGGDRRIAVVALTFLVVGPCLRGSIYGPFGETAAASWSPARVDSFGWGILIALAMARNAHAKLELLWKLAAFMLIAIFGSCVLAQGPGKYNPLFLSVIALIAAKLVMTFAHAAMRAEQQRRPLLRVAAWMGARCYSIYLLHMPIAGLMAIAFGHSTPAVVDASSLIAVLAAICVSMLLANLSYRYIEQPFIAYGETHASYSGAAKSTQP